MQRLRACDRPLSPPGSLHASRRSHKLLGAAAVTRPHPILLRCPSPCPSRTRRPAQVVKKRAAEVDDLTAQLAALNSRASTAETALSAAKERAAALSKEVKELGATAAEVGAHTTHTHARFSDCICG